MFNRIFYLQISESRLRLSLHDSAVHYEDSPTMAVSRATPHKKILAIGRSAEQLKDKADVEIIRPFSHPRAAVGNYIAASKILLHAAHSLIQQLPASQRLILSMKLIVHPERQFQGGLTDVEERTFLELGHSLGARTVRLHLGPALTTQQLGDYSFK